MQDISTVKEWHRLFDFLCKEQGHLDNQRLASDYCDFTKAKHNGAYEAALKNLNNWRLGHHTPTRRNFHILTKLLDVENLGEVQTHWNRLYDETGKRSPKTEAAPESPEPTIETPESTAKPWALKPQRIIPALALSLLFALAVTWTILSDRQAIDSGKSTVSAGPKVIDMTDQRVYWREVVELKVGQSMVVHGKRGRPCGAQPPPWPDVLKYLPELSIGVWSDGGVGFRISRACGGATPARAVVVTATRPGTEKFTLYEDPVTIHVTE